MNDTQPASKSFVFLGGFVLLLILSAFIPASWFGVKPYIPTYAKLDLTPREIINELAIDTDGDGTISWSEFVGSNGQEGAANKPIDTRVIAALNDPNNSTGSFAKGLYVNSTILDGSGITDDKTKADIVDQLVADEAVKIKVTAYTYKDIQAGASVDLKSYGNTVAPLIKDAITKEMMLGDLENTQAYLSTKDTSYLELITANKNKIDGLIKKLLVVKVPTSATIYHLQTLTILANYRDVLSALSQTDVDPVRSAIASKMYVDTAVKMVALVVPLANYFDIENIAFSTKEPGYIFTSRYTIQ